MFKYKHKHVSYLEFNLEIPCVVDIFHSVLIASGSLEEVIPVEGNDKVKHFTCVYK